MKKLLIQNLRWQISAAIFAGTVLFSVIALIIIHGYIHRVLTESLIERGRIVAMNIAELAAEHLIEEDIVSLTNSIEKFKFYANLEYILIEDFNNQVKTDTFNGEIPDTILMARSGSYVFQREDKVQPILIEMADAEIFDISIPIKEGLLGFVRLGLRKSIIDEKTNKALYFLGIVFITGTFLAIILGIFIITLQVSRPIAELTKMAYQISMGNFDIPVKLKIKNEIGVLGDAIERMRESLKTSIERLKMK